MNLFHMSMMGGSLILLIIMIRFLGKNRIPKRAFLILWSIVLIRLLIPGSLPVKVPNQGLTKRITTLTNFGMNRERIESSFQTFFDRNNTNLGSNISSAVSITKSGVTYEAQEIASINKTSHIDINTILICVWAVGCLIALLYCLFSYRRVYRKLQESLPMKLDWVSSWLKEKQIRRTIQIRCSDQIKSPLTYGIIRPRIVLPKALDLTQKDDVLFIMEHEFVHIKRFDNLRKLFLQIALCIHWFNPIVWLMQYYVQRDIEVACDERVLRQLGEDKREAYAFTLIRFAEKSTKDFLVYSGFGKKFIQERIVSIMKYKKKNLCGIAIATVLIVCSSAVFIQASVSEDNIIKDEEVQQVEESVAYMEPEKQICDEEETDPGFDQDAYDQKAKENPSWVLKNENSEAYKLFKIYEPYGISYDEKADGIYFDENSVCNFEDSQIGVYFATTDGIEIPDNCTNVYAVDENGKLSQLCEATMQECGESIEDRDELYDLYNMLGLAAEKDEGPVDLSFFTESKFYDEYKKLGLSYDEKNHYLMYQDQIVGYFQDEFAPDMYTLFTDLIDPKVEIGVRIKRDEQFNLLGLETFDLNEMEKTDFLEVE